MMRHRILSDPATPPPSPIPTGKGSRSAANEPFTRFLDRSAHVRVPALVLPGQDHYSPAKLDLHSFTHSVGIERGLESARDFGVVRIVGHGVCLDELIDECGREDREWRLGRLELNPSGDGKLISEKLRNFKSKLEEIAEQFGRILLENARELSNNHKNSSFEGTESVLRLYRFTHKSSMENNQLPLNDTVENLSFDEIYLSLHIPLEHCQIYVQSEEDHFCFDAGPETLVATIGKNIEELSHKKFKCVTGKMIFLPTREVRQSQEYSYFLELKYGSTSTSTSSNVLQRDCKTTISIGDQIIITIFLTLLYKCFMYLIS